jgi:hypothetical protein
MSPFENKVALVLVRQSCLYATKDRRKIFADETVDFVL